MAVATVIAAQSAITTGEQLVRNVVLHNISWALYRQLQEAKGEASNPRFSYDNGTLEINMPSLEHEQANRVLTDIFTALADALGINFTHAGSTTFDREDLQKAFEPNTCFYLTQARLMRGKKRVDLHTDPPPDLVIEVDVISSSLNKLPIYAALGVPEIWRYRANALTIWRLQDGAYHQQDMSQILPELTGEQVTQLLHASFELDRGDWLQAVRAVAQTLTS